MGGAASALRLLYVVASCGRMLLQDLTAAISAAGMCKAKEKGRRWMVGRTRMDSGGSTHHVMLLLLLSCAGWWLPAAPALQKD